MADRDYGWRDRDEEFENRFGREGARGPNREGSFRGGPGEGPRGGGGGGGGYGEYGGFGSSGREYEGRYGTGYGGEPGWERDIQRSREFGRNREYDPYRDYDRYERSGSYGGFNTSPSRLYGSPRERGAYTGFGDLQGTAVGRPNYTGRGPKNWKRSDERITEEANERLARDPDLDATDIDVRVSNGIVTLSGIVEDRGAKRRAEDVVEEVFGVDDVQNELKVRHGFLARLTGEHADEREVTRATERDVSSTASGTGPSSTRGTSSRATTRP
ncbi:MAG TPA: BON domain-containing protein [Gemmatimonadaceae bacterium]|nr:BON domain-containing protein [Gemmatimonadaceae bacterium]